jgi:hypothetical protein
VAGGGGGPLGRPTAAGAGLNLFAGRWTHGVALDRGRGVSPPAYFPASRRSSTTAPNTATVSFRLVAMVPRKGRPGPTPSPPRPAPAA